MLFSIKKNVTSLEILIIASKTFSKRTRRQTEFN